MRRWIAVLQHEAATAVGNGDLPEGIGGLLVTLLGVAPELGFLGGVMPAAICEAVWLHRASRPDEDDDWSTFARLFFQRRTNRSQPRR